MLAIDSYSLSHFASISKSCPYNLQFPAVFAAQVPSRTLHHPSNPFYSITCIIILSHPFSTPGHSHLMFSNRDIYPSLHAPRLWNDVPPELRTISLPPPPSLPITRHPPPLSVTPSCLPLKLKCHLFKHSHPDQSDHSPSPPEQHPP